MQKYLLIASGGALGSLARYSVGVFVANRLGARYHMGTLIINVTACIIIGFALVFLERRTPIDIALLYLVPIGFVGAYSTFSTFEWEIFSDLRAQALLVGGGYLVLSIVLGLAGCWLGATIARSIS